MATLAAPYSIETHSAPSGRSTRTTLLVGGVLAGPFYLAVAIAQALTRPGFDLRRHDISLLSNGPLGWIQVGNFLITGLLVLAAAIGMRQVAISSRGHTWGPTLVGIYGLCVALAGAFVADPTDGFPVGTEAATTMSWHGGLHLLCAAFGFMTLIAACLVFARRFALDRHPRWAIYSAGSGVLFLVFFFGSMAMRSSDVGLSVLGVWIAVLTGWLWLTAVSLKGIRS